MKVAVVMGSTSDLSKVEPAIEILKEYGVEVAVRCLSASFHSPDFLIWPSRGIYPRTHAWPP